MPDAREIVNVLLEVDLATVPDKEGFTREVRRQVEVAMTAFNRVAELVYGDNMTVDEAVRIVSEEEK